LGSEMLTTRSRTVTGSTCCWGVRVRGQPRVQCATVSGPQPIPRPDWSPLPYEGCVGVEGKVLLRSPTLALALLRFAPGGTIHEHEAPIDIDG
jgi:hypothetical protein